MRLLLLVLLVSACGDVSALGRCEVVADSLIVRPDSAVVRVEVCY